MIRVLSLNGNWEGRYQLPGELPVSFKGKVPGCAHIDLLREGEIKDPFLNYQAKDCQFIEQAVFDYTKNFFFDENPEGVTLCFAGLDTYCDIWLNGHLLGFCDNMFLPWKFDVSRELKHGPNCLQVRFYPPAKQVEGYPDLPANFTKERVHIRRMQCTFGWDWVERFVTMGIMGDVELCRSSDVEIDNVYIATTALDAYGAELYLRAEFAAISDENTLCWQIIAPDNKIVWEQRRVIVESYVEERVSLAEPELWWPNGYGEQPLYTLYMEVCDRENKIVQERDTIFGIRTIRILELQDKEGDDNHRLSKELQKLPQIQEYDWNQEYFGFQVLVNGCLVFCKGANWVPCEPFPSAVTDEKCKELVRLAAEANLNMLRVWGGGLIESEVFYKECDCHGILVIQDFLMACGWYPENQPGFLKTLEKEAEYAAKKIRNHPSLAWWTGDNENSAMGHVELAHYLGRRAANLALAPTIRRVDPYRRLLPSSPYGGKPFASFTSGNAHGTMLLMWQFGQFRESDLTDYHEIMSTGLARFNSEIPIFGAPAMSSMKRFLTEEHLYDDDCLHFHTKNNPCGVLEEFPIYDAHKTFAEKLLGTFKDEEDKLMKMRYIQYEWVRYMMELYRRNKGFAGGALFWMYNDCWPSDSWAMVDYYTNPKAGWYAFKNASRATIGSISKKGDNFVVTIINDGQAEVSGVATLSLWNVKEKKARRTESITFTICANQKVCIGEKAWELPETECILVLEVSSTDNNLPYRTVYFPKRIADLSLSSSRDDKAVYMIERGEDYVVLEAAQYVLGVNLDGDYVFEDNYFMMLPGEQRRVSFRSTSQALTSEITLYYL